MIRNLSPWTADATAFILSLGTHAFPMNWFLWTKESSSQLPAHKIESENSLDMFVENDSNHEYADLTRNDTLLLVSERVIVVAATSAVLFVLHSVALPAIFIS